jgi:hypothetical protein
MISQKQVLTNNNIQQNSQMFLKNALFNDPINLYEEQDLLNDTYNNVIPDPQLLQYSVAPEYNPFQPHPDMREFIQMLNPSNTIEGTRYPGSFLEMSTPPSSCGYQLNEEILALNAENNESDLFNNVQQELQQNVPTNVVQQNVVVPNTLPIKNENTHPSNTVEQNTQNNMSTEDIPMDVIKGNMEFCIKPARKTTKFYINYIPSTIYCSPYKYDILVKVPTTLFQTYKLVLRFLDAETGKRIKVNQKGKPAIHTEKTKTSHNPQGQTEVLSRVCFTVCSFHHFRKPFIFAATLKPRLNGDGRSPINVFVSQPFHTFARKSSKEKDVWADDDDEPKKRGKKRGRKSSKEEKASKKRKNDERELPVQQIDQRVFNSTKGELTKLLSGYENNQSEQVFSDLDLLSM